MKRFAISALAAAAVIIVFATGVLVGLNLRGTDSHPLRVDVTTHRGCPAGSVFC